MLIEFISEARAEVRTKTIYIFGGVKLRLMKGPNA